MLYVLYLSILLCGNWVLSWARVIQSMSIYIYSSIDIYMYLLYSIHCIHSKMNIELYIYLVILDDNNVN